MTTVPNNYKLKIYKIQQLFLPVGGINNLKDFFGRRFMNEIRYAESL